MADIDTDRERYRTKEAFTSLPKRETCTKDVCLVGSLTDREGEKRSEETPESGNSEVEASGTLF